MIQDSIEISIVFIIILVFFINTVADVLRFTKEENRKMDPLKTWYLLIPFFNYIWYLYVIIKVWQSLKNESASRGLGNKHYPLLILGIISAVLLPINLIPTNDEQIFELLNPMQTIGFYSWLIIFIMLFIEKRKLIKLRSLENSD